MKNSSAFALLFLMLFLCTISTADNIRIDKNQKIVTVRFIKQAGGYDYNMPYTATTVGRKDGTNGINSGSQEDIFRTEFGFSLSTIPSNATITQVKLLFEYRMFQNGLYKFKVTKTSGTKSYGDLWSEISSGAVLFSDIQYSDASDKTSTDLKNYVDGKRSVGSVFISVLSQSESSSDSWLEISNAYLSIDYTVPPTTISITTQNNFSGGTIYVGNSSSLTEVSSPNTFSKTVGDNVRIKAKEQNDNQGYAKVWANSVPTNPSKWVKKITGNNFDVSSAIEYTFTASSSDNNATYEAGLRRRYDISRNDQTDFDGIQTNAQTFQIVEQNSGTITAPLSKTVNNRNYLFYKWSDGVTTNERTVSNPTDNQTLTAVYKGHFLTNENIDLKTAGSHKFIRTDDGTLHVVYSSYSPFDNNARVFYETSSDNGTTWRLRYSTAGGLPSIAAVNNNRVIITYQQVSEIKACCYDFVLGMPMSTSTFASASNGTLESPNVAITTNGKILVTWNHTVENDEYTQSGFYARYGTIATNGTINWLSIYDYEYGIGLIAGNTARNVAIDVRLHSGDGLFHLAFDDIDSYGQRQIYYCPVIYYPNGSGAPYYFSTNSIGWYNYSPYNNCLSSSSVYQHNVNPSFIAVNGSEGTRFNWRGYFDGEFTSVFKDPEYYRYWSFGSEVTSTSINKASNGYVIAWSKVKSYLLCKIFGGYSRYQLIRNKGC